MIRHAANRGVGGAITTGYRRALAVGADVAVVMAGDGQMDPARSAGAARSDRRRRRRLRQGQPLPAPGDLDARCRRRGSSATCVLSAATRVTSGYRHVFDSQCGYTAIHRGALARIELDELFPRYGYPNDLLSRLHVADMRVVDVPVRPIYGAALEERDQPRRRRCIRSRGCCCDRGRTAARRAQARRRVATARRSRVHATGRRMKLGVVTTSYPRFAGDPAGNFVAGHVARAARARPRRRGHRRRRPRAHRTPRSPASRSAIGGARLFYRGGAPDALERSPLAPAPRPRRVHRAARPRRSPSRARRWDAIVAHWLVPSALAALPRARAAARDRARRRRPHAAPARTCSRPCCTRCARAARALVFVSDAAARDRARRGARARGWLDAARSSSRWASTLARFAALARAPSDSTDRARGRRAARADQGRRRRDRRDARTSQRRRAAGDRRRRPRARSPRATRRASAHRASLGEVATDRARRPAARAAASSSSRRGSSPSGPHRGHADDRARGARRRRPGRRLGGRRPARARPAARLVAARRSRALGRAIDRRARRPAARGALRAGVVAASTGAKSHLASCARDRA